MADDARRPGYSDETRLRQHQRYVHPKHGRLVPLVVQSFDNPQHLPKTSQWTRMGEPPSRVPSIFKVAFWIGSSTLQEGTRERVLTPQSVAIAAAKMAVASPVLYCLASVFDWGMPSVNQRSKLSVDLDLRYDGVFNRDLMYDQATRSITGPVAREETLGPQQGSTYSSNIRMNSQVTSRNTETDPSALWVSRTESAALSLRPRYLCFVKDFEAGTYETVQVSDHILKHGEQADTEFIFVSYTRIQFRVTTDNEIDMYDYPDEATREANRKIAKEDRATLIRWAIGAVKAAGKQAFWLDFECVRDADGQSRSTSSSEDVYRICDIVRASHSMIIGIGPPANERVSAMLKGETMPETAAESHTKWLRQWGSRLWTLPELLLCPSEYRIKLCISGDIDEPRELAKRNFAERAWDDAETVKDLVNHYEGSAILSPVLLIATALKCFSRRKTDQFSPGDIAYAIMGLVPDSQRPAVNQEDSGFQAFARFSLAHDDGRFLERLICLLPPRRDAKWYETDDLWGAKLNDIIPGCQAVQTGGSDSIILDGASGATINWDSIDGTDSLLAVHEYGMLVLMGGIGFSVVLPKAWLMLAMLVGKINGGWSGEQANTWFIYVVSIAFLAPMIFAILVPLLVLWRSQESRKPGMAHLFGIEGFVDAGRVERHIWGHNFGRLTQTSNIPLYRDAGGETPYEEPDQRGLAFTLVDTHLFTVTHFRASKPPVAMFVCGQEGGMPRALLCSYDADSDTYCRETVLKVHNRVLDQMKRVGRFRFALEYPRGDDEEVLLTPDLDHFTAKAEGIDAATETILDDGKKSWRLEWSFFLVTLLAYVTYENFNNLNSIYYFEDSLLLPYGIGFIMAQILTHYLLNQVPLARIVPAIASIKGVSICCTELIVFRTQSGPVLSAFAFMEGSTDSAILAIIVVFMWSWFTPEQLAVRTLIGFCGLMVTRRLGMAFDGVIGFVMWDGASLFSALLCFGLAARGCNVIATPREVTWLEAHKKILYEGRSAGFKWEIQRGASERPRWKHTLLSSLQPWLYLAVSLLNAAATLPDIPVDEWEWSLVAATVTALLLTVPLVVLSRAPGATPIMIISGLLTSSIVSLVVHFTDSKLDRGHAVMLLRIPLLTLPLTWALKATTTSTRCEGRWCLTLALMGAGAGRFLTMMNVGKALAAPLMAVEALLVGCIWLLQRTRETKAASLFHQNSIGEEYRDDIDAM